MHIDALRDHVVMAFNLPPSQYQLHLQYMQGPWTHCIQVDIHCFALTSSGALVSLGCFRSQTDQTHTEVWLCGCQGSFSELPSRSHFQLILLQPCRECFRLSSPPFSRCSHVSKAAAPAPFPPGGLPERGPLHEDAALPAGLRPAGAGEAGVARGKLAGCAAAAGSPDPLGFRCLQSQGERQANTHCQRTRL